MRRRGIFAWIFPPSVAAFALMAGAFAAFTAESAGRFFSELSSLELSRTAALAANALSPLLAEPLRDSGAIQSACDSLAEGAGLRLTVIDPDGRVLADTDAESRGMDIHLDRAEIRAALRSGSGSSSRRSATTGIRTFYEARALPGPDGRVLAVVRASVPYLIIGNRRTRLVWAILAFGAALSLLASLAAYFAARRIAAPVRLIHSGALAFASGGLALRIPEAGPRETAELARVMNRMAAELGERLETIREQKDQAEAVLNGMSEAVAVVDAELSLLSCNPAFEKFFGKAPPALNQAADPALAAARPTLMAATRNPELCDFMEAALRAKGPLETGLRVYGDSPRELRAISSPLGGGKAVLVLSDLTRLRRLETVRSDFTANVSHELKTPITSIRAALETLAEETIPEGAEGRRFLDIALRGAGRLEAILEDLLSLARIEEEERKGVDAKRVPLGEAVEAALAEHRARMEAAGMAVELSGDLSLVLRGHRGLLVQAISNLVDNAVKYASAGKRLGISARAEGGMAVLSVSDSGPGIPERDRGRLFERFYRVDKARSRDSGGTGLGLAIVKHVAQAHSGSVRLEEGPGPGATFSLLIPLF